MSLIHKLDDITINKIAAGEVIENPSSVVKELVDNALDAGASSLHIDIKGGGRDLIRVKDNGSGMGKEDALLCLERHATSKLKTIDDIHALYTRGFRGEAIPSIASISKMTLRTCLKGEKMGTLVIVEGGHITLNTEVAAEEGTQIEVENLFFNVPVRRKFQRSPSYDAAEVEKMLILLALGHPNVSFHLTHNGKTQFVTKQESGPFNDALKRRIDALLGEGFSKPLHGIDEKRDDYHLQGWISPPFLTRPNKTGQYIFVNGRAVNSSLISFAVKEAFGYSIAQNRYPLFVLFLNVPKEKVDINVHPQKKEVRFQQEPHLREFIVKAIEKNLQALGVISRVEFTPREPVFFPEIKVEMPRGEAPKRFETPLEPMNMKAQPPTTPQPLNLKAEPLTTPSYQPPQPMNLKAAPPITSSYPPFHPMNLKMAPPTKSFELPHSPNPSVSILATIAPYILALIDDQPFLIDQVRAKNRLFFDQVAGENLQSQRLLIPFSIPSKVEGVDCLGFSIKEQNKAFIVEAIPSVLTQEEAKTFLEEASEDPEMSLIQELKKRLTKRLAAFTSKKRLHPFEAEALVKNLLKQENSVLCPFGFPLRVPLTADKLKNLMG